MFELKKIDDAPEVAVALALPTADLDPRRIRVCPECQKECQGNVGYAAHMRWHKKIIIKILLI